MWDSLNFHYKDYTSVLTLISAAAKFLPKQPRGLEPWSVGWRVPELVPSPEAEREQVAVVSGVALQPSLWSEHIGIGSPCGLILLNHIYRHEQDGPLWYNEARVSGARQGLG